MRWIGILVVVSLGLSGCVSNTLWKQAVINEAITRAFVVKIDKGETTREEEQVHIKAQSRAWTTFRESLDVGAGGK